MRRRVLIAIAIGAAVTSCALFASKSEPTDNQQVVNLPDRMRDGGTSDGVLDGYTVQPEAAVGSSLIGFWTFDEDGGVTSEDKSGYGHPATLTAATFAPTAGLRGGAVSLDGNGRVDVPALGGAAFPRSGTVSIWFNYAAAPTIADFRQLFDAWQDTRDHIFVRYAPVDAGVQLQLGYQVMDAGHYPFHHELLGPPLNTWSHFVFTWSADTKSGAVYMDGALLKAASYGPEISDFVPDGQKFQLGSSMVGALDEVRLYDRALSVSEAAALP